MNNQLFQKGQQVMTPDGAGDVIECIGEQVKVKFDSGEIRTYDADKLEDNADAG